VNISKTVWNFCIPSAQFYGGRGLYGMAAKRWGFPRKFSATGRRIFLIGLFKGSLIFYCWSYGGATYAIR